MKKNRSILIMVVALVVMIAAFAIVMLVQKQQGDPDQTSRTSSVHLVPLAKYERESLRSIRIENPDGSLEIEDVEVTLTPTPTPTPDPEAEPATKEAGETEDEGPKTEHRWKLVSPAIDHVDEENVSSTATSLLSFTIVEDITDEASDDLSVYGLEDTKARVIYTLRDGSTDEVRVGDKVADKDQYYAYHPETKRIAVVTSPARALLKKPTEYVSSEIFPFMEATDLRRFDFYRSSDDMEIHMEADAPGEEDEALIQAGQPVMLEWQVTDPLTWEANQEKVGTLITSLLQLRTDEQITLDLPEDADKTYGFDAPQYRMTLGGETDEEELVIGKSLGNGKVYGKSSRNPGVFTLSESALQQVGMAPVDFYNGFIALENIWFVGEIEANIDGIELHADVFSPSTEEKDAAKEAGEEEPQPRYLVNGENANIKDENDKNYFTQFYQRLIGVMARGVDLEADPALKDPQFSFTLKKRDGGEDVKVDLVPRDERTWYIFRNEEYTGFYTSDRDLFENTSRDRMGLKPATERLMEAVEHQQSGFYESPSPDGESDDAS